ncbi:MAG: polyhydroxyalkanoate depolymerase, partial [Burkholderiaceae bacterium]
ERVRPQDITQSGLLTIEGELDDISGSGQTAAAHGLCSGIPQKHQMHYEAKGAGHYGIFSGRRWREMVYPVVKRFILSHQAGLEAKAAPVAVAAPATEPAPTAAAAPAPAVAAPARKRTARTAAKAATVAPAKAPAQSPAKAAGKLPSKVAGRTPAKKAARTPSASA